jgi:hypothetical protein
MVICDDLSQRFRFGRELTVGNYVFLVILIRYVVGTLLHPLVKTVVFYGMRSLRQ